MTSILNAPREIIVDRPLTHFSTSSQKVAVLADGSYVVVTSAAAVVGGLDDIFMQIYNADGTKRGTSIMVNTTTAGHQTSPDVAATADGGFVVAWTSGGQDGSGTGIYAQRFYSDGTGYGAELRINSTTLSGQSQCSVYGLYDGDYVVTWTDASAGIADTNIRGTRVSISNFVYSDSILTTTIALNQVESKIIQLTNGDMVLAWRNEDDHSLYFQIKSDLNVDLTTEIVIASQAISGLPPTDVQLFPWTDGKFIVAWTEFNLAENDNNVKYKIVAPDGVTIGPIRDITPSFNNTTISQYEPRFAALADGGFIAVWSEYTNTSFSNFVIKMQRYDENANPIGDETLVNQSPSYSMWQPSVSATDDGGFIISWVDTTSGSLTKARRFTQAGSLVGTQYLYGTVEDDILDGGSGADNMFGGAGNDTYFVNSLSDYVSERTNEGIDTVVTSLSTYVLGLNIENLTFTGVVSASAAGNALNNFITGNNASNAINGNDGNDTIYGLDGDDQLFGGKNIDYIYGGNGSDYIDGGENGDNIFGEDGNDFIYMSDGYDYVDGGQGLDTYYAGYASVGGYVNLTQHVAQFGTANVYLFSIEGVTGSALNDIIIGDAADNHLAGFFGADKLYGRAGDDTYYVDNALDRVYESESGIDSGGHDTVISSVNYILGAFIEDLELDNTATSATGNTLDNRLVGTFSANTLDGREGADMMWGRGGDDIYTVDNLEDYVSEEWLTGTDDGGDDRVNSSVNYTLGNFIERLTFTGTANVNGVGNGLDNTIVGNSGTNILIGLGGNDNLNGGAGIDTMFGGAGNDTYTVDTLGDIASEQTVTGVDDGGDDRVNSSISFTLGAFIERLSLTGTGNIDGVGNALVNTIIGNSGNNKITGGGGNDNLQGGAGNDTYIYGPGFGRDTITDTSGTDTIQFGLGITAGMIIQEDVGADRYYAISEVGKTASQCNVRIRVIGGAGGAVIENIVYSTDPAPASSATLIQAMVALPQETGSAKMNMAPNLRREAVTLTAPLM